MDSAKLVCYNLSNLYLCFSLLYVCICVRVFLYCYLEIKGGLKRSLYVITYPIYCPLGENERGEMGHSWNIVNDHKKRKSFPWIPDEILEYLGYLGIC